MYVSMWYVDRKNICINANVTKYIYNHAMYATVYICVSAFISRLAANETSPLFQQRLERNNTLASVCIEIYMYAAVFVCVIAILLY